MLDVNRLAETLVESVRQWVEPAIALIGRRFNESDARITALEARVKAVETRTEDLSKEFADV